MLKNSILLVKLKLCVDGRPWDKKKRYIFVRERLVLDHLVSLFGQIS